jgi:hypothetical protein
MAIDEHVRALAPIARLYKHSEFPRAINRTAKKYSVFPPWNFALRPTKRSEGGSIAALLCPPERLA